MNEHQSTADPTADEIAQAYRAFVVNECLAAGVPESHLPLDMPFNELVRVLVKAKEPA